LARLGAVFFAASVGLILIPKAGAQDRQAIERSMVLAMPPGGSCSKGRHPMTCEFRKGGIDYDIEYSHLGEGHAVATMKFAQKSEYRRYLDLLMKFLTVFGVTREQVEACVAEALEATTRSATGRAEIRNQKFLMSCDFYGQGNSTFKDFALVLELRRLGSLCQRQTRQACWSRSARHKRLPGRSGTLA
jgi:hypothetical protein